MKRGTIEKLTIERWCKLFDSDALEVQLVAYGMPETIGGRVFGMNTDAADRQLCTTAFVDFRNYTEDDGRPILNSLDERLFLFKALNVRRKIVALLEEMNSELGQGEESGADV